MSAGKVDIGAFRTYPQGHVGHTRTTSAQAIPLDKIEDFGVHAESYYPIAVSYLKSKSDSALLSALWNKYWINTLTSAPLLSNLAFTTRQIRDVAQKMSTKDHRARSKHDAEGDTLCQGLCHAVTQHFIRERLFSMRTVTQVSLENTV